MENPFKKNVESKDKIEVEDIETEESTEEKTVETDETEHEEEVVAKESTDEPKDDWKEKYETLNSQYIRLAADFDNYRKRQESEKENLLRYGAENTVKKLLEVIDNFERGLKAIETVDDCEKVKECYNLAYKNFNEVLSKIGVEVIKAEGEEFDPNLHEAVMQTPTKDYEEHTVIAELQKGYKLGDKVLRPALVNVATVGE